MIFSPIKAQRPRRGRRRRGMSKQRIDFDLRKPPELFPVVPFWFSLAFPLSVCLVLGREAGFCPLENLHPIRVDQNEIKDLWESCCAQASPNQVFQYPDNYSENGSANSKSNIQFVVTTHDFKDGRLLLKCSATIHNIYHRSTEVSIDEEGRLINTDSTQIVVVSANFQDELDENGRKRRRYDSGHESGSPRLGKTTTSLLATALCINIFVLILR